MKNLKRYTVLIFLLSILGSSLLYSSIVKKMTVNFSNFTSISKNCYIDSEIEEKNHKHIQSLIDNAKQRIIDKFGSFESNPIIIVTGTQKSAKEYGTNDFGSTVVLPWNQYVVFGPKGHNIDVMAHELLHAEIGHRLGYFIRQFKLPVWLDEGIAMQVDYRKKYDIDIKSINSSELKRVKSISKRPILNPNHFWSGGEKQVVKNYQISKALVSEILNQDLNKSLYSMLKKVKEGKEFEDVFSIQN